MSSNSQIHDNPAPEFNKRNYLKYKWLFDHSVDAILVMKNYLFIESNPAALKLFHCTSEEIIGRSPSNFSPELQPNGENSAVLAKRLLDKAMEKGEFSFEWMHKKLSGELFNAHVSLKAFEDEGDDYIMAVVRDITEKKMSVNFRNLAHQSLVGVYLLQDQRFVYANPELLKILGYPEGIPDNVSINEIVHPDDIDKVLNNINKRLVNQTDRLRYQFRIIRPSGEVRDVEAFGSISLYKNRYAIHGTLIDLTETKAAQEQIRMLAHALKSISQAVSVTDMNNRVLFVNDAFLKMYGYEKREFDGWRIEEVRSDRNEVNLGEKIRAATISGGWNGNVWNKRRTGEEFLAHLSTSIVKDDSGNPIALMGIVTDITESKKSEEQVNLLTTALHSAANGIIITNSDGVIIWVNHAVTILTGYFYDELIGKHTNMLKSGKMDEQFYTDLWNTVKIGRVWRGELINRKKNGDFYFEEMTITPVRIDGNITHYIAIKQDITSRKNYENELEKAKTEAETANRLKSNFLANMSHELRTPMVGILGYADILNYELQETEYKDMARNLYDSGNRLMETLNLILHLSKLESNILEMEEEVVNAGDIVEEEVNWFMDLAKKRGLTLEFERGAPAFCYLEKKMLKDVLHNLISNAIKFTNTGGVKVKLITGENTVKIMVSDTGIGIKKEVQPVIFEEFRQASEGINRKFEGTGLGLTISQRFVKLMHGNISVESEENVGSTFTVELPLYKENKKELKTEPVPAEPGHSKEPANPSKKVLLVENDRASREITRLFLKKVCSLDFAEDAESAFKLTHANNYDAILMDINLDRGVSGLDVTKIIRQVPGYSEVPIIALTAYALEGDQEQFLAAGCTHYLSKPFDRATITGLMKKILDLHD